VNVCLETGISQTCVPEQEFGNEGSGGASARVHLTATYANLRVPARRPGGRRFDHVRVEQIKGDASIFLVTSNGAVSHRRLENRPFPMIGCSGLTLGKPEGELEALFRAVQGGPLESPPGNGPMIL
jgi:hypothetical protein